MKTLKQQYSKIKLNVNFYKFNFSIRTKTNITKTVKLIKDKDKVILRTLFYTHNIPYFSAYRPLKISLDLQI